MSDNLEASTAKALDKLTTATEAVVAKLGTLAEKYGPEAIDAGLSVVRIGGVAAVVSGTAVGVAAYLAFKFGRSVFVVGQLINREWQKPSTPASAPSGDFQMLVGVVLLAASGGGLLFAVISVANVWNWVAIFEPKLWIAKKLLGL